MNVLPAGKSRVTALDISGEKLASEPLLQVGTTWATALGAAAGFAIPTEECIGAGIEVDGL